MNNPKLLIAFVIAIIVLGSSILFGLGSAGPNTKPPPSTTLYQVAGDRVYVTKVVDGDTIKVYVGGEEVTVRILGVDTPETVDPRKSVQCFGKEASNETKRLLTGKEVILQKDVSDKDKYNRLLRYVFLPLQDGQILNIGDYLIREGYALVLTIPPDVKYSAQFLQAQKEARVARKGLWGKC